MSSPRPFAAAPGWRYVSPPEVPPGEEPPPEGEEVDVSKVIDLLEAILAELREQAQQGYVTTVTQPVVSQTVPVEVLFSPSLFTIGLTNDGPNSVLYRIPNRANAVWVQLNPTEVVQFNFTKGVIPSVAFLLVGAPGLIVTTVRVVGAY